MSENDALWLARVTLADPYPEDIFTPLSKEEMASIQVWLKKCPVRNASDRLHASWARHLFTSAEHYNRQHEDDLIRHVGEGCDS